MTRLIKSLAAVVAGLFGLIIAVVPQAHAQLPATNHVSVRLIAASGAVPQGGEIQIALDYTHEKDWHSYYSNPGEAGQATTVVWDLPPGVTVEDWRWPTPERLDTLGLKSYGYSGRTALVTTLRNTSGLAAGSRLPVRGTVTFLVCKDICIPESHEIALDLVVGQLASGADTGRVNKAIAALPARTDISATLSRQGDTLSVSFRPEAGDASLEKAFASPRDAYVYAAQEGVTDAAAIQVLDAGPQGFTLRVRAAKDDLPEGDLSGIVVVGGKAFEVAFERAPPLPGTFGLGAAGSAEAEGGVLWAMWLALIGGAILNLMPCVFPVLSIKLLALTRAHHDRSLARLEALTYGAGAVLSFLALAAIIEIARTAGASLGWGFQLQSPYMTAGLSLVMLLVALNLAGLFNIGAALQALGGGVSIDARRPLLAAFLTGVLAVVVAAPCTAPFMAAAIGVALSQGGFAGFAIFLALGVGFALPFVALTLLLTVSPALARWLPRPGRWMETLKKAMSVLMFGAVVWLVWVFAQQMRTGSVLVLALALLMATAGVLPVRWPVWLKAILVGGGVVLGLAAAGLPRADKAPAASSSMPSHEDFSFERLTALRAEGKPVFIDMTAAWCVTCKVNERLVLSTPEFRSALEETGTMMMVGDWTNQDAQITRFLSLHGRSGVPLYVYYPAKGDAVVLPQMLSTSEVTAMLRTGSAK